MNWVLGSFFGILLTLETFVPETIKKRLGAAQTWSDLQKITTRGQIHKTSYDNFLTFHFAHARQCANSQNILRPYLTLPPGWTGFYTCPALRPYQFGPMRVPECNHKVTGSGYKAVDGCEAINRRL